MKTIALNTIGLTGVEVLQMYLSELKDIAVLPGQNFVMYSQALYRPHNYIGCPAAEVFAALNQHLFTKGGRIWMGLTKHMDPALRESYQLKAHKEEFIKRLGQRRQFFDCIEAYCASYFAVMGYPAQSDSEWTAFYSCNIALNLASYPGSGPTRIINLGNKIDFWLASISQTRTWNCIEACKFWLVNNLYLMHFQTEHSEYYSLFLEELIDDPKNQIDRICAFLGISTSLTTHETPGIIRIHRPHVDEIRHNAALLREIYRDEPLFLLADTINHWGKRFIEDPEVKQLLTRFARFWNTTSHTNFDWVGPIADQIVNLALLRHGTKRLNQNISQTFYHEYFKVHSDSHERIESHLSHFLGCLEEEIVLPLLPYFLKVAMTYIISISRNYAYHAHSYVQVRKSNIYCRLQAPIALAKIKQFGLTDTMLEMEREINAADESCAHLFQK